MELEKELMIEEFIAQGVSNVPFILNAGKYYDDHYNSHFAARLTFDGETLSKYGLHPAMEPVGKLLVVTLKSRERHLTVTDGQLALYPEDLGLDNLYVDWIERRERQMWSPEINQAVHSSITHVASFTHPTPRMCPSYRLTLDVSEQEYNQLKQLPNNVVMNVSFGLKR